MERRDCEIPAKKDERAIVTLKNKLLSKRCMSSEKTLRDIILSEEHPLVRAQLVNHYVRKIGNEKGTPEQYEFARQQYFSLFYAVKEEHPELAAIFQRAVEYCESKYKKS